MRPEMRSHHRLAELARRQHGVVSSKQLAELGYSAAAVRRSAMAGRLHRVHRGVYVVGHRRTSRHTECIAAVLACGEGAVASHSTAGWLWDLLPRLVKPVHVSVPTAGHARQPFRAHHAPALKTADRGKRDGIPVTAVPRTLLDRLFDLDTVDVVLSRTTGHHGCGRLRRAIEVFREPAFTRSELERRFLELVREAGLPLPSANLFVAGYELDMYWPKERFAVELDGYEHHRTRAAFERDRIRQEDLKLAGIEMTRVTAARLSREPKTVATRLRRLLAQRRSQ